MTALAHPTQDDLRRALENAEWDRDHWANVIAEGKVREFDGEVLYRATPETARRYAEAVAAVAEAREALLQVAP